MKRLVSGIKPTGDIHLGNYFGAVAQMLKLQETHECFIFIADLHALNQVQNQADLSKGIIEVAKAYLAAGLDPEKVVLFQQSQVSAHAELATILAPSTSLGLLERAHAFKDATAKKKAINAGLFYYPVLMAADILLYKGEVVPVGIDQDQHLEMAREIANRFNHTYGKVFPLPLSLHAENVPTVTGTDGQKMSKSYNNVLGLFDTPDTILKKVARVVTDSKRPEEPKDPKKDTIFQIFQLVATKKDVDEMREKYLKGGIGYKDAKQKLADAVISFTEPIRERKSELDRKEDTVRDILRQGATSASLIAADTLQEVFTKTGLK